MERMCTRKVVVNYSKGLNKEIKAEVQFGAPSNKCKGVGICRVSTLASFADTESSSNRALAIINISESNQVVFQFLRHSISPEIRKIYFQDLKFVVLEEFSLPQVVTRNFKSINQFTIHSGVYEVKESEYFLTVSF